MSRGYFDSFPSKEYSVADIYAVIAYFLTHKPKIDKYIAEREREAERFWAEIESEPQYQSRMDDFKKLRK